MAFFSIFFSGSSVLLFIYLGEAISFDLSVKKSQQYLLCLFYKIVDKRK